MFVGVDYGEVAMAGGLGGLGAAAIRLLLPASIKANKNVASGITAVLILPLIVLAHPILKELRRGQTESAPAAPLEPSIENAAALLNFQTPERIDAITTRTRVTRSDKTLTLHHTLDAPLWQVQKMEGAMAAAVKPTACQDDGVAFAIRTGATVVYAYELPSGGQLFSVAVRSCA